MPTLAGNSWLAVKDWSPTTFAPTALVTIALLKGPTLYLCSRVGSGGPSIVYAGNAYLPRISNSAPGSRQATSAQGIDVSGTYSIDIADADWEYTQLEAQYGYQGATLKSVLVIFDPDTNTFSSDQSIIFTGMCDSASRSGNLLTITATSAYDMRRRSLPDRPIQVTCPHNFPTTQPERLDGANNALSQFYNCGYSPDISGGVGNLQGSTPYPSCDKSKASCVQRGMFYKDAANRQTYRFGGSQWQPPATWKGKSYTAGKTTQGINSVNPQKYQDFVPESYGTSWVTGIVANVVGDPNYTGSEVIISNGTLDLYGDIYVNGVLTVVENGLYLPRLGTTDAKNAAGLSWTLINLGYRTGNVTNKAVYNKQGDPYGSMCAIFTNVYAQAQASNTQPQVSVLVGPRPIPVFSSANVNAWSFQRTGNSAWVLLEIMRRGGIDYSQWDLQSVINCSYICGTGVPYTRFDGTTGYHQRYNVSITIDKPSAISTIVNGIKDAARLMVVPNVNGSALRMVAKQTLSAQQPSPVLGSNTSTGYPSYKLTDDPTSSPTGVGYFAYSFDETNINVGTIKLMQSQIADQPDVLVASIQDEDNDWTPDTVTNGDDVAYNRILRKIQSTFPALGLPNYDQANRALETKQFELYRGNPRGDSGGTWQISFDASFRCLHLNQGDIVAVSFQAMGLSLQPFRVIGMKPNPDFESATLTLQWHDDRAYTDKYGQGQSPYFSNTGDFGARPPYPWQPNQVGNQACDSFYSGAGRGANSYKAFDLEVGADELPDQTIAPEIVITGQLPVNQNAGSGLVPRIASQGQTGLQGGLIPDNSTIYAYVSATDGSGNESPLQIFPCVIAVPGAYNTNVVTIPIVGWPPGTVGWNLYTGTSPQLMSLSLGGSGTPSSITATALATTGQSPVDARFDHFILRAKHVSHPGYLLLGPGLSTYNLSVNSVTATTITFAESIQFESNNIYTPSQNELAGYTLVAAFVTGGGDIPFLNLKVASNNGLTLTIDMSHGYTDLTTLNLSETWFIALRKVVTFGSTTINFQDSNTDTTAWPGNFLRVISGAGVENPPMRIIAGNLNGGIEVDAEPLAPLDATSVVIVEEDSWRIVAPQSKVTNSNQSARAVLKSIFDNTPGQCWYVQVSTADNQNREDPDIDRPGRLFYWQGSAAGQPLYAGINLIPNADLAVPARASGEVVAGWTVFANDNNQYSITADSSRVFTGQNSFKFSSGSHTIAGTSNPNVPTFGPIAGVSQVSAAPYPNPRPGENYLGKFAAYGIPSSPPASGCQLIVVFRLVVTYSDGSLDQATYPGGPLTGFSVWQQFSVPLTINASKTPDRLYTTIEVYWVNTNPGTTTVLPPGGSFYVWVSGLSLVRLVDLNTEATSSTSHFLKAQASLVPTESIAIRPTSITPKSISLAWDDQTRERSHAEPLKVSAGTATFDNLEPATEHFFDPYVDEKTGTVHFGHGDTQQPPTSPSSAAAITAAKDGRHPQRSFSITTPKSTPSAQSGSHSAIHPDSSKLKKRWIWSAMKAVAGYEHPQPVARKYAHHWTAPMALDGYQLAHCSMTLSQLEEAKHDDRLLVLPSLRSRAPIPTRMAEELSKYGVSPEMTLHETLEHLGETVDPQFLPES